MGDSAVAGDSWPVLLALVDDVILDFDGAQNVFWQTFLFAAFYYYPARSGLYVVGRNTSQQKNAAYNMSFLDERYFNALILIKHIQKQEEATSATYIPLILGGLGNLMEKHKIVFQKVAPISRASDRQRRVLDYTIPGKAISLNENKGGWRKKPTCPT